MFKIVNCGEEGGFWIEGPTGRMGASFLVEGDAEDYVETLEKGVQAEHARLKKLVSDANFAETSPFANYKDEVAFMDGFAAGVLARSAEIRRELLAYLLGMEDDNAIVNGSPEHAIELLRSALDRIIPEAS